MSERVAGAAREALREAAEGAAERGVRAAAVAFFDTPTRGALPPAPPPPPAIEQQEDRQGVGEQDDEELLLDIQDDEARALKAEEMCVAASRCPLSLLPAPLTTPALPSATFRSLRERAPPAARSGTMPTTQFVSQSACVGNS